MSQSIAKSVNFGSRKGSLATVGYRLLNADGSVNLARTTSGITELIVSTGLYGGTILVDEEFKGFIVWDTGEGTPLYAMEQFDFRAISSGGGVSISHGAVGKGVWTEAEKNKLLKRTKRIITLIKGKDGRELKELIKEISESITNNQTKIKELVLNTNKDIINSREASEVRIDIIEKNTEILGKALEGIVEYFQFKQIVKEVDDHVEITDSRIKG